MLSHLFLFLKRAKLATTFVATILVFLFANSANAKLKVVATTSDVGAIVREVTQEGTDLKVELEVIAKGTQDPHHIEAKPSFILVVNRADLVISNGLSLEVGWLPSILRSARNAKVSAGQTGFLELGPQLNPIEIQKENVSREMGDVHPDGNPHFTLDPVRVGQAAVIVAVRLGDLDPSNKEFYLKNAESFKKRLEGKIEDWQKRIKASGVKQVVTYHRTLNYFLDRFAVENSALLEPKPGVPPTGPHIMKVISIIKEKKIPLILVENYFDLKAAERIQSEVPGLRVHSAPVAIASQKDIQTFEELFETLVKLIEKK
jgi:zinc/manganese transport system substrate-binding protein